MNLKIAIGLLALLPATISIAQLPAVLNPTLTSPALAASPSGASTSAASQDVFYMSSRFGFRFGSPSGYVVDSPSIKQSASSPLLQVVELWQQKDYLNRTELPETPPIIRIAIYNNAKKLPLAKWKGELSHNDDRSLTVAGQRAIAYTSDGLYANDNVLLTSPDNRYVLRMQVGYLNKSDRIRQVFQEIINSFTFDTIASSNSPSRWRINYKQLQSLLAASNWQAADIETRAIIERLASGKGDLQYGSKEAIKNLPCQDLQTIDNLWTKASKGRFGYSAQQRLWQQISTGTKNQKAQVEQFGKVVGWRRSKPLPDGKLPELGLPESFWRLDTELNYTNTAPIGHLPWMGTSTIRLTELLQQIGCGSCTIDAMYLSSDRYDQYLPALFTKLKACRK